MKCLHNSGGLAMAMLPQSRRPLADSIIELIEYTAKRLGYGVFGEEHVYICLTPASYLTLCAEAGEPVSEGSLFDTIVDKTFFGLRMKVEDRECAKPFCLKGHTIEIDSDRILKVKGIAI